MLENITEIAELVVIVSRYTKFFIKQTHKRVRKTLKGLKYESSQTDCQRVGINL